MYSYQIFQNFCHKTCTYNLLLLPILILVACFFRYLKTFTEVLFAWVTLIFSNISERWLLCTVLLQHCLCVSAWQPWAEVLFCCVNLFHRSFILKSQPEAAVPVCRLTTVPRLESSGLRTDFTAAAAAASLPSRFYFLNKRVAQQKLTLKFVSGLLGFNGSGFARYFLLSAAFLTLRSPAAGG